MTKHKVGQSIVVKLSGGRIVEAEIKAIRETAEGIRLQVSSCSEGTMMRMFRTVCHIFLLVIVAFGFIRPVMAQDKEKQVPTDEEIKLLVTQIDRAMNQYEALVKQEKQLLGNDADVAADEKLIGLWRLASKATNKDPQRFNSIVGYDIVTMLDDAARNAALVPGVAYKKVIEAIANKTLTAQTDLLVTLAQNATAADTLLFTVSESASSMYLKFLEWQEGTFHEVVGSLTECLKMLKVTPTKK
jgi:hypothetical protein